MDKDALENIIKTQEPHEWPWHEMTEDEWRMAHAEKMRRYEEEKQHRIKAVQRKLKERDYEHLTVDQKIEIYYHLEKLSRHTQSDEFPNMDAYKAWRNESYIELSYYEPIVKVLLVSIIPYLPLQIVSFESSAMDPRERMRHHQWVTIDHVTLYSRQKYRNGQEHIAFWEDTKDHERPPYLRLPNTRIGSAHEYRFVHRVDAERMGVVSDYTREYTIAKDDVRPVIRNSAQFIIY